jgi:hypothetical protein
MLIGPPSGRICPFVGDTKEKKPIRTYRVGSFSDIRSCAMPLGPVRFPALDADEIRR